MKNATKKKHYYVLSIVLYFYCTSYHTRMAMKMKKSRMSRFNLEYMYLVLPPGWTSKGDDLWAKLLSITMMRLWLIHSLVCTVLTNLGARIKGELRKVLRVENLWSASPESSLYIKL